MLLNTGQIIHGRYRIVKQLSQGGFGRLYRAWDLNLRKGVALKENLETTQIAAEQFQREAELLAHLTHPNLARVTDYFEEQDMGQFLVMDYVEGEDLDTWVQHNGPATTDQAVGWISQVCDALSYIHNQRPPIIHRDIKPANIRITPEGRAVLVDFGIAKEYDAQRKTTLGARAVTAGYSPVEQYGSGRTDARTDIYALSATLYHLITAQHPPESTQRLSAENLVSPVRINPQLSPALSNVVIQGMQINPGERYQNAQEFKTALLNAVTHPLPPTISVPKPITTPPPPPPAMTVASPLPAAAVLPSATAAPTTVPTASPRWIEILLLVLVVVTGMTLIVKGLDFYLVTQISQGNELPSGLATAISGLMSIAFIIQYILLAACGVGFLIWVSRTARTLLAMGRPLRFSPGWAAGGMLVPLWNLVHSLQVMGAFWRLSDPSFNPAYPASGGSDAWSIVCWLSWLTWGAVFMAGTFISASADRLYEYVNGSAWLTVAQLLLFIAAFALYRFTALVNRRIHTT